MHSWSGAHRRALLRPGRSPCGVNFAHLLLLDAWIVVDVGHGVLGSARPDDEQSVPSSWSGRSKGSCWVCCPGHPRRAYQQCDASGCALLPLGLLQMVQPPVPSPGWVDLVGPANACTSFLLQQQLLG